KDAVANAQARRDEITAHVESLLGTDGILVLPTSPRVAPLRNTPVDRIEVEYRNQAMCLLSIAGLARLPQVSLPMARLDGLPLGLSLVGPRDSDAALLAFARELVPPI